MRSDSQWIAIQVLERIRKLARFKVKSILPKFLPEKKGRTANIEFSEQVCHVGSISYII